MLKDKVYGLWRNFHGEPSQLNYFTFFKKLSFLHISAIAQQGLLIIHSGS